MGEFDKIEKLPRKIRKKIAIVLVVFSSLSVAIVWLIVFLGEISRSQTSSKASDNDLDPISQEINQIIDQAKQTGADIQKDLKILPGALEQVTTTSTPADATTTPVLMPAEIEALKERLEAQQATTSNN